MISRRKYPHIRPLPGTETKTMICTSWIAPAKCHKLTVKTNKAGPYSVSGDIQSILFAYSLIRLFIEAGGELVSISCRAIGPGRRYDIEDLDRMLDNTSDSCGSA